ncbi:hypothetical protein [Streptomyces sp. NPDC093089]|uniref:hypothetical protein n=1 Tax=Streptomyces sp. NPDC093089 TaxID=3366024 RepID=UPI00380D9749
MTFVLETLHAPRDDPARSPRRAPRRSRRGELCELLGPHAEGASLHHLTRERPHIAV